MTGSIPLTIYGQDGELVTMQVADTTENRIFTEWLRRFDRYTVGDPDTERAPPRRTRTEWLKITLGEYHDLHKGRVAR